jgi:hypothetical protein
VGRLRIRLPMVAILVNISPTEAVEDATDCTPPLQINKRSRLEWRCLPPWNRGGTVAKSPRQSEPFDLVVETHSGFDVVIS